MYVKKIAFLSFVFCFPYSAFGQSCADGERLYELTRKTYLNNQLNDSKVFKYCGVREVLVQTKYYYDGNNTKITTFNGIRLYNKFGYIVFEEIDTMPSYEYYVPGDQVPTDVE
ncbi:hypothetical protein [Silvanigrella paludirubra]|uniref:hypothetical protein n=1 Tax=Silvanigrella paludirubra TaxID=2499159 RepID=UPI0013876650|nr:hypothetical protein [Silvanigrella paludirubra]